MNWIDELIWELNIEIPEYAIRKIGELSLPGLGLRYRIPMIITRPSNKYRHFWIEGALITDHLRRELHFVIDTYDTNDEGKKETEKEIKQVQKKIEKAANKFLGFDSKG